MFDDGGGRSGLRTPYDELLRACDNNTARIQKRYDEHRCTRNMNQKARMLAPGFEGVEIDPILYKLIDKTAYPDYTDPRHCLVFWARPTEAMKAIILQLQSKLREAAPNLWLMPPDNLHMTVLEITHSRQEHEIAERVRQLEPFLEKITDYTYNHRVKLIKPVLSFDASAMALSFLPASHETGGGHPDYTYHHLRRDIYELCSEAGAEVDSRYVLPSAHLTVARFVSLDDTGTAANDTMVHDPVKMQALIGKLESINQWLEREYWKMDANGKSEGEWTVGQEKGLDCQLGTLWYGFGDRVRLGKGF